MRVNWQPGARADALDIADYIDIDSPATALAVYEKIHRQVEKLGDHPWIGRAGKVSGTRELIITGTLYIAIYRVEPEAVTIVRVIHGAQKWPPDDGPHR